MPRIVAARRADAALAAARSSADGVAPCGTNCGRRQQSWSTPTASLTRNASRSAGRSAAASTSQTRMSTQSRTRWWRAWSTQAPLRPAARYFLASLPTTLVALGADVIAVEPDPAMLTELRRALPAVRALPGSAEAIPLPDASVDAVLAVNALHWFDIAVAGPEMARVLAPGGILAGLWNVMDNRVDWVAGLERVSGSAAIGPRDTLSSWRAATAPSRTAARSIKRREDASGHHYERPPARSPTPDDPTAPRSTRTRHPRPPHERSTPAPPYTIRCPPTGPSHFTPREAGRSFHLVHSSAGEAPAPPSRRSGCPVGSGRALEPDPRRLGDRQGDLPVAKGRWRGQRSCRHETVGGVSLIVEVMHQSDRSGGAGPATTCPLHNPHRASCALWVTVRSSDLLRSHGRLHRRRLRVLVGATVGPSSG
jgi:SAM-dependent methyltransferase